VTTIRVRRRRLLPVLAVGVVAAAGLAGPSVAGPSVAAKAPSSPAPVTVKVVAGTSPGTVTVSWTRSKTKGKPVTTGVKIETGVTQFSPYGGGGVPVHSRISKTFTKSWKGSGSSSLTFTKSMLASAGSPFGSGNPLYFRLWTLHKTSKATSTRSDGKLYSMTPKGQAPTGTGAPLVIASYNVRSAGLDLNTAHDWYHTRVKLVAQKVLAAGPGIVAFQEAIPTGKNNKWNDNPSGEGQIASLVDQLNADTTPGRYAAVRLDYYDLGEAQYAGTQQGMRIVYDTTKYKVINGCADTPGKRHGNTSCSIQLPLLSGDSASLTRWAAYAQFQQIDSLGNDVGGPFWVVSLHLDERGTPGYTPQTKYNSLRLSQMKTIISTMKTVMAAAGAADQPLIIAGDVNDWQNDQASNGWNIHDYLVSQGFFDTVAAAKTSGLTYASVQDGWTTPKAVPTGFGPRYDIIMYKAQAATGAPVTGATSYTNAWQQISGQDPSDHNMEWTRFNLP
jgi:endonuclease/exonuclease/phosphatase family metal-dependent hydrolase